MDGLIEFLAIIGAYFAILLVLSVTVEALLDLTKLSKWYGKHLAKRISPEQALQDVAEWVPEGSQKRAKIMAISNLASQLEIGAETVQELAKGIDGGLKTLGVDTREVNANLEKELAALLYAIREQYNRDSTRRVAILRALSVGIAIPITLLLQLDTFELLADLFSPEFQRFLAGNTVGAKLTHLGGMILTGFAASAGSSFWHDMLGRVRAAKEIAEQAKGG